MSGPRNEEFGVDGSPVTCQICGGPCSATGDCLQDRMHTDPPSPEETERWEAWIATNPGPEEMQRFLNGLRFHDKNDV